MGQEDHEFPALAEPFDGRLAGPPMVERPGVYPLDFEAATRGNPVAAVAGAGVHHRHQRGVRERRAQRGGSFAPARSPVAYGHDDTGMVHSRVAFRHGMNAKGAVAPVP